MGDWNIATAESLTVVFQTSLLSKAPGEIIKFAFPGQSQTIKLKFKGCGCRNTHYTTGAYNTGRPAYKISVSTHLNDWAAVSLNQEHRKTIFTEIDNEFKVWISWN